MKRFDWKRVAFIAVPLVAIVELVAHVRQSTGAPKDEDWASGSALWNPRPEPEEALRELPGARRVTGDPLRGESAAPPTSPAAPTARRRRRARHAS